MVRTVTIGLFAVASASAVELREPRPVIVGHMELDVEHQGSAAPFVADFDGDGLRDLLVGESFQGRLRIYRNVGKDAHPVFEDYTLFPKKLGVRFSPQIVDFDGDGRMDVLSAKWPGRTVWFRATDDGFEDPESLNDKDRDPIQLDFIFSSFAWDWDADGDNDVVVGGQMDDQRPASVYLLENLGPQDAFIFETPQPITAAGKPIEVESATPAVADWDNDGRPDLVMGGRDGSVVWFRNVGAEGNPQFDGRQQLLPPPKQGSRRGRSARICVVDWNLDGKLDLVVGDTGERFEKELNPIEQEKRERARRVQQTHFEAWAEFYRAYRNVRQNDKLEPNVRQRLIRSTRQGLREAKRQMEQFRREELSFQPGRQHHGRVWVCLRR